MVGKGDKRETKKTYPQHNAVDRSYRFMRDQAETALLLADAAGQARRLLPYQVRKMIPEKEAVVKGEEARR